MKVDLVVNTMIQQIDRNLQSQVVPVVSWRAGELLRGKVMLTNGERLQIRLDSGALLNAIPSGDVLLNPGATVTLRVTGQMDGQLVMQLLDQELTGERASTPAGDAGALLERMNMDRSPKGKAVAQAMERMKLPLLEETARTAMDTMARFPGLSADKAVFLAANHIPPTAANVEALNNLVDHRALTGGELLRLMDLLDPQQQGREWAEPPVPVDWLMENGPEPNQPTGKAAVPQGLLPDTETLPPNTVPDLPHTANAPGNHDGPAVSNPAMTGWEGEEQHPATQAGIPTQRIVDAAQVGPEFTASSGNTPAGSLAESMLQLQSLVQVALGAEGETQYSGALMHLERYGLAKQATALILESALLPAGKLAERTDALLSGLPDNHAAETRQFIGRMASELGRYLADTVTEAQVPQTGNPVLGPVLRGIAGLFARLDSDNAAESLKNAATEQVAKVSRVLSDAAGTGAASGEAVRQMDRITSHVRLIADISQYAYQQIPIELNGKRNTVELYVMNRGRGGRKVNADQANILIALDTDSLGHLETLIHVSQKNLRLRFGVEKPELTRFVESHMTELGRSLGEIGYRLSDLRTQVISKPVSPLTVAERVEPDPPSGALDMRL